MPEPGSARGGALYSRTMITDHPLTPLRLRVIASLLEAGASAEKIAVELEMPIERVEVAIKALAKARELEGPEKLP